MLSVFFFILFIFCESASTSDLKNKKQQKRPELTQEQMEMREKLEHAVNDNDEFKVLEHLKAGVKTCGFGSISPVFYRSVKEKRVDMITVFLDFASQCKKRNSPEFIHEADMTKWSPLMEASHQGNQDLVVRLLKLGARPSDVQSVGMNALTIAAMNGHHECVKIIHSFNVDREDDQQETAFHKAAIKGDLETVKVLAGIGAQIDKLNRVKENALILALRNKSEEVADYLIDLGVPIQLENTNALIVAVKMGYTKIVKKLLDKEIDINFVEKTSWRDYTALLQAVKSQNLEIFKLILSKNPNLELKTRKKMQKDEILPEMDVAALIKDYNLEDFKIALNEHIEKITKPALPLNSDQDAVPLNPDQDAVPLNSAQDTPKTWWHQWWSRIVPAWLRFY